MVSVYHCFLLLFNFIVGPIGEKIYILAKLFTIQQYHVSRMSRFFHPTTADALSGLGVGTWKSQKGSILIKKNAVQALLPYPKKCHTNFVLI